MRKLLIFILMLQSFSSVAQLEKINKLIADSSITGIQIAHFSKNKTSKFESGFANSELKTAVNENTMFQAASLTKVLLAYITLELVDQGKINLDQPLSTYFNYQRIKNDPEAKKITARIALKHLTGFPNWVSSPTKAPWLTAELKSKFEPGSQWQYSGEGFFYLQATIEHILDKDFQQIVDEMIFQKLGMKNSTLVWNDKFENQNAFGHNASGKQSNRSRFIRSNSAFTLLTTASDYILFLKALNSNHLKSIMADRYPLSKDFNYELAKQIEWGLGAGLFNNELGTNVWHWGDNSDFKAFFMLVPKTGDILVCFTNSENGLKIMPNLCEMFLGIVTWFTPPNWLE